MRRKLSCQHCSVEFDILSPGDGYTEVTLEACDFATFDKPGGHECLNCKEVATLYWHNPALERKELIQRHVELERKVGSLSQKVDSLLQVQARVWEFLETEEARAGLARGARLAGPCALCRGCDGTGIRRGG